MGERNARAVPVGLLGRGRGLFDAEELEPLALARADVAREEIARGRRRPEWRPGERHACFLHRAPTLLVIAAFACRHDVLPGVLAAAMARDHVIEGEIVAALAAVLTGV